MTDDPRIDWMRAAEEMEGLAAACGGIPSLLHSLALVLVTTEPYTLHAEGQESPREVILIHPATPPPLRDGWATILRDLARAIEGTNRSLAHLPVKPERPRDPEPRGPEGTGVGSPVPSPAPSDPTLYHSDIISTHLHCLRAAILAEYRNLLVAAPSSRALDLLTEAANRAEDTFKQHQQCIRVLIHAFYQLAADKSALEEYRP